jgi:hypothetical protein
MVVTADAQFLSDIIEPASLAPHREDLSDSIGIDIRMQQTVPDVARHGRRAGAVVL